jgi:hypothetical protein
MWFKWLNQRSQRKSFNWEEFQDVLKDRCQRLNCELMPDYVKHGELNMKAHYITLCPGEMTDSIFISAHTLQRIRMSRNRSHPPEPSLRFTLAESTEMRRGEPHHSSTPEAPG